MTLLTASWIFLLENGVPGRWLWPSRESNIFLNYSSLEVAVHDFSYYTSSLSIIFLLDLNMLKALKYFGISYVTSLFASFCSVIVHYNFSSSVEYNLSSLVEQICDKILLTMMTSDLYSSVEQLCDKVF